MRSINDYKIRTRLNVVLSVVVTLLVGGLFTALILNEQSNILKEADKVMEERVSNLALHIEEELEHNQSNVDRDLVLAHEMLYADTSMRVALDSTLAISAVNQISKESHLAEIPLMILGSEAIYQSNTFVDRVGQLTGSTSTIFQRIPEGFLRVSTNVRNKAGERATGTYIPNDSPVVQAVMAGETFRGRAWVVDDWYLTAYEPIRQDGQIMGILYVGVKEKDMAGLKEIFSAQQYYESGYPYLVSGDGTLLLHPTSQGKNISEDDFFKAMLAEEGGKGTHNYLWEGKKKIQYFQYIAALDSYVSASLYESELMVEIRRSVFITFGVGLFIILSIILTNSLLLRSLSRGLNKSVEFASRIASGDLSASLDIQQQDELGQLAETLNNMRSRLHEIVHGIVEGAGQIASASSQMSSTSESISQGASEQASSVEEVSSTMEQMAANIHQNTESSQETEKISQASFDGIREVSENAARSVEATNTIAEKIQIVNDIALQTNILALNAAVEAARAGEQGKGFAVVAAEVRKLAERSKGAADEIVDLSQNSKEVAENAGKRLHDIMPGLEKTTSLVQEISSASMEQNNGAAQVNSAIQQLNSVTQQNAASAEEMATSSEELASQASQLKELVSFFQVGESPVGESPVDESPVGQASVGQSSVGESSVGQSRVGQSSVGESPVGQSRVGESPVGQAAVSQSSVGESPETSADASGEEKKVKKEPVPKVIPPSVSGNAPVHINLFDGGDSDADFEKY